MTSSSNLNIHDTFCPSDIITDPSCFAGRRGDIERALQALRRRGTSMIVYGDRGVGKSSFIEMIKQIAEGDTYLIEKHELDKKYPPATIKYCVASFICDVKDMPMVDVLHRLLSNPEGLRRIITDRQEKLERQARAGLNMKNLKNLLQGEPKDLLPTATPADPDDAIERFSNTVQAIEEHLLEKNEGLLIIIDEFDRVRDKEMLSGVIKARSKHFTKFLIAGIAKDYHDLIEGHQSLPRQFQQGCIKIEPMEPSEINMVFDLAQKKNDDKILFNQKFRDEVIAISDGYPYFIQLCGQLALDSFADGNGWRGKGTIDSIQLQKGLTNLVQYEPQLDTLYHEVIGTHPAREVVLKYIANQLKQRVGRHEVLQYAESKGIEQPEKILTQLLAFRYSVEGKMDGRILEPLGDSYVHFVDILFKLFVRTRTSLFE